MDTSDFKATGPLELQTAKELEDRFGAHNYRPLPLVLTRGEGVYVFDIHGNRYLDMMSAYSAVSHGHAHPKLLAALQQQAQRLAVVSRAFYTDRLGPLLAKLCRLTGQDMALPMNTGAEAVETAIKAARKWAYERKGVAEGQAEIIACDGNFHGRTLAAIAMSCEPLYREHFEPMPGGFKRIPYGDAAALAAAITADTAAFIVEPIQGEAGIVVPPAGYLKACENICRERNVLLICDEVQTGLGRTGMLLASEHEQVKPDGLLLGKALGGGLLPISMFLAKREVMEVFTPGTHGSTFGGNPLACAVADCAIDVLLEERLVERARDLGAHLIKSLSEISHPAITAVRGRGLLVGVAFDPAVVSARTVCERLSERGVLSKETHDTVVRFAPPLVIEKAQLDWALEQFKSVLQTL